MHSAPITRSEDAGVIPTREIVTSHCHSMVSGEQRAGSATVRHILVEHKASRLIHMQMRRGRFINVQHSIGHAALTTAASLCLPNYVGRLGVGWVLSHASLPCMEENRPEPASFTAISQGLPWQDSRERSPMPKAMQTSDPDECACRLSSFLLFPRYGVILVWGIQNPSRACIAAPRLPG